MITTSLVRIESAERLCSETSELIDSFRRNNPQINPDTEYSIVKVLPEVGLANTLFLLGNAHPRYKLQVNAVLAKYIEYLILISGGVIDYNGLEFLALPKDFAKIVTDPRRHQQCVCIYRDLLEERKHIHDEKLLAAISFLLGLTTPAAVELNVRAVYGSKRLAAMAHWVHGQNIIPKLETGLKRLLDEST